MDLLTVKDAAERLGISEAAVYQAVKDGRLPSVTVLGRVGIKEKDLANYQPRGYRGERLKTEQAES